MATQTILDAEIGSQHLMVAGAYGFTALYFDLRSFNQFTKRLAQVVEA